MADFFDEKDRREVRGLYLGELAKEAEALIGKLVQFGVPVAVDEEEELRGALAKISSSDVDDKSELSEQIILRFFAKYYESLREYDEEAFRLFSFEEEKARRMLKDLNKIREVVQVKALFVIVKGFLEDLKDDDSDELYVLRYLVGSLESNSSWDEKVLWDMPLVNEVQDVEVFMALCLKFIEVYGKDQEKVIAILLEMVVLFPDRYEFPNTNLIEFVDALKSEDLMEEDDQSEEDSLRLHVLEVEAAIERGLCVRERECLDWLAGKWLEIVDLEGGPHSRYVLEFGQAKRWAELILEDLLVVALDERSAEEVEQGFSEDSKLEDSREFRKAKFVCDSKRFGLGYFMEVCEKMKVLLEKYQQSKELPPHWDNLKREGVTPMRALQDYAVGAVSESVKIRGTALMDEVREKNCMPMSVRRRADLDDLLTRAELFIESDHAGKEGLVVLGGWFEIESELRRFLK